MYQRKVDVDMPNAVKNMLADISSVSPSSEQRKDVTQLTKKLCACLCSGNQELVEDCAELRIKTKTAAYQKGISG